MNSSTYRSDTFVAARALGEALRHVREGGSRAEVIGARNALETKVRKLAADHGAELEHLLDGALRDAARSLNGLYRQAAVLRDVLGSKSPELTSTVDVAGKGEPLISLRHPTFGGELADLAGAGWADDPEAAALHQVLTELRELLDEADQALVNEGG